MPKTVQSIAALLLSLAPAAAAWAGNDEGIPLGDDAALTGCTVAAMVSDGSSLFYNPAGLAGAERDQVDGGGPARAKLHRLDHGARAGGSPRIDGLLLTAVLSCPA